MRPFFLLADPTRMASPRLLAIDGLNIVRRVYEASPEPDSEDKAELALRHALSSLRNLINDHRPSHVLPAFDFGGPTWRHALYPRYKQAWLRACIHQALPLVNTPCTENARNL